MAQDLNAAKTRSLLGAIDWERPGLAAVHRARRPAEAFLAHLARSPRPRFRFEWERKAELLAFLRATYPAWRRFDPTSADRLAALSIEAARGPRALAGVADLGRAWLATGDPRYGTAFERFYRAGPSGSMFNWGEFNGTQGAIDLDAWFLLLDCPGFSTAGRIAFLDHLRAIADDAWDTHTSTWRQTMLGPEGHNWYLHGMRVLPFLGLLFPEFHRAPFLLRTGLSVVDEHLRGHFRADGGARETNLAYQAGSMLNLWDFYLVARRNGHPLAAGFEETLLRGTLFLLRLMTPLGGLPSFGDGGHAPGGLTRLAAVAAALSGDRHCKWFAERCRAHQPGDTGTPRGTLPPCAFWDVGLAGADTYAAARPQNPHLRSVLMGDTGYAALRAGSGARAACLHVAAADRGPIVTSHGHNDVLAIDVSALGVRFLGEMGCAPYGTSPGRDYDQKTEAHNTLAIAGQEQNPIVNEWRWRGMVIPAVRRWLSCATHDFFHGVHEGYYRWPAQQTLHARKILFVKASPVYWVVLDWLESNVQHDYRAWFHGCVPGRASGTRVLLGAAAGPRLAILPPAGERMALAQAQNPGLTAYCDERGLCREEYPCFVYAARAASTCLAWVLVPHQPGAALPTVRRLPVRLNGRRTTAHEATALEIGFPEVTDQLCVSHKDFDADLAFGGQRAWGHLVFQRAAGRDEATRLEFAHVMADGCCGR